MHVSTPRLREFKSKGQQKMGISNGMVYRSTGRLDLYAGMEKRVAGWISYLINPLAAGCKPSFAFRRREKRFGSIEIGGDHVGCMRVKTLMRGWKEVA